MGISKKRVPPMHPSITDKAYTVRTPQKVIVLATPDFLRYPRAHKLELLLLYSTLPCNVVWAGSVQVFERDCFEKAAYACLSGSGTGAASKGRVGMLSNALVDDHIHYRLL